MTVAAAVVSVGVVVGTGALLAHWQAEARTASADQAAALAMDEATRLWKQARAEMPTDRGSYAAAVSAAAKADDLAKAGPASSSVQQKAAELRADVETDRNAAVKNRRLLAAVLDVVLPQEPSTYRRDESGVMMALAMPSRDEQYAAAFRSWGLNVDAVPTEQAVARLRARPAGVVAEVVAALDAWAEERRAKGTHGPQAALAAELDSTEVGSWRYRLREILNRDRLSQERVLGTVSAAFLPVGAAAGLIPGVDRRELHELRSKVNAGAEPVLAVLTLARALENAGDGKEAEELLRQAVLARPAEAALWQSLGDVLRRVRPPSWAGVVECYQAARALRPQLGIGLAMALAFARRAAEGEALAQKLLHDQPNNPELAYLVGCMMAAQDRYLQAEVAFRQAIRIRPEHAVAHRALAFALSKQRDYPAAETAYREAIRLKPTLSGGHRGLGFALFKQGKPKDAEAAYSEAIRLNPDDPEAHHLLGSALFEQDKYREAEAACRRAIRLQPDLADAHANLGAALAKQGKLVQAEAACREALRLKPDSPEALLSLGNIQLARGNWRAAEAAYRDAIRYNADKWEPYANLGSALASQGKFKEAETACREAIRLQPDHHFPRTNLAATLLGQRKFVEAEAACREALRLKPDYAEAHSNLGAALLNQGKLAEAEAACLEAVRLNPGLSQSRYVLGQALAGQARFADAEASFRETLKLSPDDPLAHCHLGLALQQQGRFEEALAVLKRGHELGSKTAGWRQPSAKWVRECESLVALDRKLPAVLRGEEVLDSAAHRAELAEFCRTYKRKPAAAARLFAAAFAMDPRLADDLTTHARYNAACVAILAATGQGKDGSPVPDRELAAFRSMALAWLRADLTAYGRLIDANPKARPAVLKVLQHYRQDPDLAAVRDGVVLAALPETERAEWEKLWADLAELLKKVGPG